MADHVVTSHFDPDMVFPGHKARKTIARLTASGAVETTSKGCAE